mmetsp:Transcript_6833/g.13418  ORF Transcript_6833/g.13418 Transcript_6833/m.13418 type:complete len:99 (+) Transcript_6833:536-832(+)
MSNFLEALTLHVDIYGNLVALDYKTPFHICGRPKKKVSQGTSVRSKGRISAPLEGKKPDLTKLVLAENKGPPPKTFFQKYWMYMLIAGLVFLTTSGGG